jgi:hypothetical protein
VSLQRFDWRLWRVNATGWSRPAWAAGLAAASFLLVVVLAGASGSAGSVPARAVHAGASRPRTPVPVAGREAVARALGADEPAFRVRRLPTGSLVTRGGGVRAVFGSDGVAVSGRHGASGLQLGLSAIGRSGSLDAIAPAAPLARAGRVVYARARMREWYANGPLGIEQGFSLAARPAGTGVLTLVVGRLGPGTRARLGRGGSSLAAGGLRYGEVTVTDARGRAVRAWLSVSDRRIRLRIADRGARYPLAIDPLVQTALLTASDAESGDQLGSSLAISADGRTIAAAASGRGNFAGAVYVFSEPSSGWANAIQTAELTASNGVSNDQLGFSIAISSDGQTITAGAAGRDSYTGAVYVFSEPSSGWVDATQTAELTTSDGGSNDQLGASVAISADGQTIAAGAQGRAVMYVFSAPSSGWANATQTAELTASDQAAVNGGMGQSVAISANGETIAAGGGSNRAGAVYVFSEPSSGWTDATQTAKLSPSDGVAGDDFAKAGSVAISASGETIAAGDPFPGSFTGAVYVFSEPSSGWVNATQTAELTASDGYANEALGYSVAISPGGETVTAGAVGSEPTTGAPVYVFSDPPSGWTDATQTAELFGSNRSTSDFLGTSVASSANGNVILAGPSHGNEAGSVWVWVRTPSSISTTVGDSATKRAWSGSETAGAEAYDTASLPGIMSGSVPTGKVTYSLYRNTVCSGPATSETVQLNPDGSVPDSSATDGLAIGQYSYQATYSGDDRYQQTTGSCEPFTVPGAPSVSITSPTGAATYGQHQIIAAHYSCSEGAYGPGLQTGPDGCHGTVAVGAEMDTQTTGLHEFTVTATSLDGQTTTQTASYTVSPIGAGRGPQTVLRILRPGKVCAPVSDSRACLARARALNVVLVPAEAGWRGILRLETSRGRPIVGAAVQVLDRARSIAVTTNRSGSASFLVLAGPSRTLRFEFAGSTAGQPSSAREQVRNRPSSTLRLVRGVGGPGKILLAGVAVDRAGARAGEPVSLQLRRSGRWVAVAVVRAAPSNGWWNATVASPPAGMRYFRTVIDGTPSTSLPVTLR